MRNLLFLKRIMLIRSFWIHCSSDIFRWMHDQINTCFDWYVWCFHILWSFPSKNEPWKIITVKVENLKTFHWFNIYCKWRRSVNFFIRTSNKYVQRQQQLYNISNKTGGEKISLGPIFIDQVKGTFDLRGSPYS